MKSLRNKVILSAIVLAFALIATIGSTYAWFIVSQNVTVESMTLNVTAEDSLLIKVFETGETASTAAVLDILNYSTTLSNQDLIDAGYTDLATYKLQPVSSIQTDYLTSSPKLLTYLTSLTDYARPLATAEAYANNATNGKFVELKFWLYSQSATNKDVVLDDYTVSATNADSQRDAITDAVRLAIWEDGQASLIYGNSKDFLFAFESGLKGYYSGTPDGTHFNTLVDGSKTPTEVAGTLDSSVIVDELAPNTPTLVVVRIYVEGWDADVTNAVISAAFDITWIFAFAA